MKFFDSLCATVIHVFNFVTLSHYNEDVSGQVPMLGSLTPQANLGPIFRPPGHTHDAPGYDFKCNYTLMPGWTNCSTADDRGCWLKNEATGKKFTITTDYDKEGPVGVLRQYSFDIVDNKTLNTDGLVFPEGKLFDNVYPGPWVQACWGDTVEVTIHNKMKHNGTSVHWHGIRQLNTFDMDGVNGVTQCPIAPGYSFTYRWKATQYGSSWYHSHYGMQYGGWCAWTYLHNGAFQSMYPNFPPVDPTILLNGKGNITRTVGKPNKLKIPKPETIYFDGKRQPNGKYKKYLLRLINTSFDSTFVFSIDNHNLTIVSADFVPIHPYSNSSVLIGIGQRYNVIVEANPLSDDNKHIPEDGNFWIRTYRVDCGGPVKWKFIDGYERSGILRYNIPSVAPPESNPWKKGVSFACSDETYESLVPVVPWTIEKPANGNFGEEFGVKLMKDADKSGYYPMARFAFQVPSSPTATDFVPLRVDYSNPTINGLANQTWDKSVVMIKENYQDRWVIVVIAGDRKSGDSTTGAHPIHLHGHDFALLQQVEGERFDITKVKVKSNNPPRRDVVLLPRNGFVIIAFKTDNPGAWLVHCHIAAHIAMGLGLQILERQEDLVKLYPPGSPGMIQAQQTCESWNTWNRNCSNWWSPDENPHEACECNSQPDKKPWCFFDDSGL